MATKRLARTEFAAALNQIASERGIDAETVLDTIKAAMVAAYRKDYGDEFTKATEAGYEYDADIDPVVGSAKIFKVKGKKRKEVTPPDFGRIAAQTAKQVILQRVREAEKDAVIEEYSQRLGAMVSGMVLRFDGINVIIDIGRGQGVMPPEEQIRAEYYKLNQRLMVLLKEISDTARGQAIIVSRSSPDLIKELFAREVPEVNSGVVKIKAIAREAGIRTKIAVHSTQAGVDPVGSCVGQKGIRVQAVINELGGEKIDIIQYSNKSKEFITAALSPAEGLELEVDEKKKHAVVTVPDDQLSLAIGRGGQNVRLAAKLTGYKIDIKGESAKATMSVTGKEEFEIDQLKLSTRVRNILVDQNLVTIGHLSAQLADVKKLPGIGPKAYQSLTSALEEFSTLEAPPEPPPASEKSAPQTKTDQDKDKENKKDKKIKKAKTTEAKAPDSKSKKT